MFHRPSGSWACWDRSTGVFGYLTDHDASSSTTQCVKLSTAINVAKLTYYGGKLIQLLRSLPPPVE